MDRLIINMRYITDKNLAIRRSANIVDDFIKTRGDQKRITITWDNDEYAYAYHDKYKDGIVYNFADK